MSVRAFENRSYQKPTVFDAGETLFLCREIYNFAGVKNSRFLTDFRKFGKSFKIFFNLQKPPVFAVRKTIGFPQPPKL
jgi:hypothetical protein